MKRIHNDVITALFLILVASFFIVAAQTYDESEAGTFPIIFAILLILTSLPILKSGITKTLRNKGDTTTSDGIPGNELFQALTCFALLVIYAISIQFVGFFVSTAIFLSFTMWLLGVRNWKTLLLLPLGIDATIYFIMVKLLFVRLPHGALI